MLHLEVLGQQMAYPGIDPLETLRACLFRSVTERYRIVRRAPGVFGEKT